MHKHSSRHCRDTSRFELPTKGQFQLAEINILQQALKERYANQQPNCAVLVHKSKIVLFLLYGFTINLFVNRHLQI